MVPARWVAIVPWSQPTTDFAGKAELQRATETQSVEHVPHRLRRHDSAIFAAPILEDFWITCATVNMPCMWAS